MGELLLPRACCHGKPRGFLFSCWLRFLFHSHWVSTLLSKLLCFCLITYRYEVGVTKFTLW